MCIRDRQNDMLEGGALPCKRINRLFGPLDRLFAEARRRGVPVIYVCDSHRPDDEELKIWEDHCIEGTWGAGIIDELTPKPGDYVVKKSYFNGFVQTDLQELLDRLEVGTCLLYTSVILICFCCTLITFIVDLLYASVDPRIKATYGVKSKSRAIVKAKRDALDKGKEMAKRNG